MRLILKLLSQLSEKNLSWIRGYGKNETFVLYELVYIHSD